MENFGSLKKKEEEKVGTRVPCSILETMERR